MAGKKLGTIFVELGLDSTEFTKGEAKILQQAQSTNLKMEQDWRTLGSHSDLIFNAMKANITNAYDAIKNKSTSSAAEILRAEETKNAKIQSLNDQQFGKQTSLIDGLKAHWIAATVAIAAATAIISKGIEYYDLGAKVLQTEESFRLVTKSSGIMADKLLADMKRASAGTVDDSDIMQKAVKGITLGLKDTEMIGIMEAARVSARVAGEDVKTAYEGITDAISTGLPKALKRYGLISKEEMAIVSAALKAGVEDVSLYSIAMNNAAIQAAKFGALNETAAEGVQIHRARIQDFKESIGTGFVTVVGTALGWLDKLIAANREAALANEGIYLESPKAPTVPTGSSEELEQRLSFAREIKTATIEEIKAKTEAKKNEEKLLKEAAVKEKQIQDLKVDLYIKDEARKWEALEKYNKEYEKQQEGLYKHEMEIFAKTEEENAKYLEKTDKDQRDGAEKYKRIVSDEYDFAATENEREINKIIHQEKEKVDIVNNVLAFGYISFREAEEKKALFHANAAAAILEKETENALKISKLNSDLIIGIRGWEVAAYNARISEIDAKAAKDIKDGADYAMVMARKKNDTELAYIAMGKSGDDFVAGITAGYLEMERNAKTFGQAGYEIFNTFATASKTAMSTIMFDSIKTGTFDAQAVWTTFTDSMLRKFTDTLSDMGVEGALKAVKMTFSAVTSGDWSSVLGLVNKAWDLGNSLLGGGTGSGEGSIDYTGELDMGGHYSGGLIPGNALHSGDNHGNDTIPARVSPGEYFEPRTAVNPQTFGMLEYIRKNKSLPKGYFEGGYIQGFAEGGYYQPTSGPGSGLVYHESSGDPGTGGMAAYWSGFSLSQQRQELLDAGTWTQTLEDMALANLALNPNTPNPYVGGVAWEGENQRIYYIDGTSHLNPAYSQSTLGLQAITEMAGRTFMYAYAPWFAAAMDTIVAYGQTEGDLSKTAQVAAISAIKAYIASQIMTGGSEQATSAAANDAWSGMAGAEAYGATTAGTEAGLSGMTANEAFQWALDKAPSQVKKWLINKALGLIGNSVFGGAGGSTSYSFSAEGDLSGIGRLMGDIAPQSSQFSFPAYNGLDYVPYDDMPIRAHKKEAILNAEDAEAWRSRQGGGEVNHFHLHLNGREIAYAIADEAERNPRLKRRLN